MTKLVLCRCRHSDKQHTKMNKRSWNRLSEQIGQYEEKTFKDRERFWTKFLTGGSPEEWSCSKCSCDAFKLDNLKYLEQIYERSYKKNK